MATLLENKKIRLDYEILETFETGIELLGFEVKALRSRMGSLLGAHVTIRGDEAFLIGMTIPPYQPANTPSSYDPERNRRLLLTKKEIARLAGLERQKGLTIVPISVYNKGSKLKVAVALVRGKKKHDKREAIRTRDAKREMERELKRAVR
jgi:SsrA-binding protein